MNLKKKLIFLTKVNIFNKLKLSNNRKSGVNFSGKKTIRNRGFISKKKKRQIDHFRVLWHLKALILNFEYDPNRKTLINLVLYFNGIFSYHISLENSFVGMIIYSANKYKLKLGCNSLLKNIPKIFKISSLEHKLFKGSKLLRSCSSFGKILKKNKKFCFIKLKSKKIKKISTNCTATIGSILNFNFYLNKYKKAGFSRLKGFRPTVRGVAMNPVDHPHGGGEGKKSKKRDPMSPWGKKLNFRKNAKR